MALIKKLFPSPAFFTCLAGDEDDLFPCGAYGERIDREASADPEDTITSLIGKQMMLLIVR